MRFLNYLWCSLGVAFFCTQLPAQRSQEKIDSLQLKLASEGNDSVRVEIYNLLSNLASDSALAYSSADSALKLALKLQSNKLISDSYRSMAQCYLASFDYVNGAEALFTGLKYCSNGENDKAQAQILGSLGNIYTGFDEYNKARECYLRATRISVAINDTSGIRRGYVMLGSTYKSLKNSDSAGWYYRRGLDLALAKGNPSGAEFINMGFFYESIGKYDSALAMFDLSDSCYAAIGNPYGKNWINYAYGETHFLKKEYVIAAEYLVLAYEGAHELEDQELLLQVLDDLYQVEKQLGKHEAALDYLIELNELREIMTGEEKRMQLSFMQSEFEREQKNAIDKLKTEKSEAEHEAELQKQKTVQWIIGGILLLVLVVTLFVFRGYRQKRAANEVISLQKALVEEKHKEITDSINYAERIQRSFLATEELLNENLKEYFVFFQPKDVVSGDFYWASTLSNGNFALVTADSTGHGVPGAIMSILNISSLEKAIEQTSSPSEILNKTRSIIIDRLSKDGSAEGGKDGMDCSLIVLNKERNQLSYAAANNPIWIVRDETLLEFAPDKMPVGKHDKDQIPFSQHNVDLKTGDVVYTLTDGMADQFGGPKGKKFMYKQLKELLVSISHLPMSEQQEKLAQALQQWKGNLEQVDDVCVIGIRI